MWVSRTKVQTKVRFLLSNQVPNANLPTNYMFPNADHVTVCRGHRRCICKAASKDVPAQWTPCRFRRRPCCLSPRWAPRDLIACGHPQAPAVKGTALSGCASATDRCRCHTALCRCHAFDVVVGLLAGFLAQPRLQHAAGCWLLGTGCLLGLGLAPITLKRGVLGSPHHYRRSYCSRA